MRPPLIIEFPDPGLPDPVPGVHAAYCDPYDQQHQRPREAARIVRIYPHPACRCDQGGDRDRPADQAEHTEAEPERLPLLAPGLDPERLARADLFSKRLGDFAALLFSNVRNRLSFFFQLHEPPDQVPLPAGPPQLVPFSPDHQAPGTAVPRPAQGGRGAGPRTWLARGNDHIKVSLEQKTPTTVHTPRAGRLHPP